MPIAQINPSETQTFDLKSIEGGEITLKRMSYGSVVERRAMLKLTIDGSGKGKNQDFKGEMAMSSKEIQWFEFKNTVVGHNLQRLDGSDMNLTSPVDLESLDPRVGQEIEGLISDMNNLDEDDQGN